MQGSNPGMEFAFLGVPHSLKLAVLDRIVSPRSCKNAYGVVDAVLDLVSGRTGRWKGSHAGAAERITVQVLVTILSSSGRTCSTTAKRQRNSIS